MKASRRTTAWFRACATVALLGTAACGTAVRGIDGGDGGVVTGDGGPDGGGDGGGSLGEPLTTGALDKLDLLLELDNTGSMGENSRRFGARLGRLIDSLTNPPDRNGDGRPDYAAVADLHVGVITPDLGTPGADVRGCDNGDHGDDGLLNPIRNGEAMARHQPWTTAPAGYRPDDCNRSDQFPSFLAFASGITDPTQFEHDLACNALVWVNGCGLEQQLEAVYRALVVHHADDRPGNTDLNAGFLREDAVLAIVLLTDEEDGSVRDCRYAEPGEPPCEDGVSVYQSNAAGWSSSNLNMRFYMYQPCQAQDPTWRLDRYLDPSNPNRGFLGLKPGHPERVIFGAITGMPLSVPTVGVGTDERTDWDLLLGPPGPGGANDFCNRDASRALDLPSNPSGPISLRQANRDPNPSCTDRTVPACRQEGSESSYDPAMPPCAPIEQYFAWPARRILEIVRRFDQAPMCNGAPCRNGFASSICRGDFSAGLGAIVERIRTRLSAPCLERVPATRSNGAGQPVVACAVRELVPDGPGGCDSARGRVQARDASGAEVRSPSPGYRVCTVCQVPAVDGAPSANMAPDPACAAAGPGAGWYHDTAPDPTNLACRGRIAFTAGAAPSPGAAVFLQCAE